MGKRRFAKDKAAVSYFRLVHRAKGDPNAEGPEAGGLVLAPVRKANAKPGEGEELGAAAEAISQKHPEAFAGSKQEEEDRRNRGVFARGSDDADDEDFGSDFDFDFEGEEDDEELEVEKRLDELDEDCYFPKDGYDYSKHLKTMSKNEHDIFAPVQEGAGSSACSSSTTVTTSEQGNLVITRDLGMIASKEGNELFEAIEDPDAYEEIDDDFFGDLVASGVDQRAELEMVWGKKAAEKMEMEDGLTLSREQRIALLQGLASGDGGSEFDNRSDVDPVTAEHRALVQAKLEKLLGEYDEDEIGELDEEDEELQGKMNLEDCEEALDEFLEEKQAEKEMIKHELDHFARDTEESVEDQKRVKELVKRYAEKEAGSDEEEEEEELYLVRKEEEQWDCESILSTRSNTTNHPGKINRPKRIIKLVGKHKLPALNEEGAEPASGKEKETTIGKETEDEDHDDSEDEEDELTLPEVSTFRPKDETTEERKERKAAAKEMKRICRQQKKENKEIYKTEKQKLSALKQTRQTGDIRQGCRIQKV